MELGAPGLETSLVRLAALDESHRGAVTRSNAVKDMWTLMPVIPPGVTIDTYFDYTLRMGGIGTGQGMSVFSKETGELIGLAAYLLPNRLHRRVRIGYTWLEQAQRGTGIVNHVQYLMIRRAFEWRARRIEWQMSTRSERAAANVERLGAVREGTLRKHSRMADGSWADVIVLSLVGEEIRTAMRSLGIEIGEIQPETASGA